MTRKFKSLKLFIGTVFVLIFLVGARASAEVPSFIDKVVSNPFLLLADRIIGSLSDDRLRLEGRVRLTNEGLAFFADQVEIRSDTARFEGRVTFKEDEQSLLSDTLQVNLNDGTFHLERAFLNLGSQFMTVASMAQDPSGMTRANHLILAPCPDCSKIALAPWQIYARTATYDPKSEQIRARDIQLNIFGTPVASLPYWQLANPALDRLKGFLQPKIETSNAGGLALKLTHFSPVDEHQDWSHSLALHSAGGLQLGSRYRFSDQTRRLILSTRLIGLTKGSSAQSKLRQADQILADVEINGDWFINGNLRLRGQGRWETNDSFGAQFGHDTRLFRPTEFVLERFDRNHYSSVSLSKDIRSAAANSNFPQNEIPLQLRARYEISNQSIGHLAPGFHNSTTFDFRALERESGRDSAHLAIRSSLSSPIKHWHGQQWQLKTFATGGFGKAEGLDQDSNDFAPLSPNFSGQSSFSTFGLRVLGQLPLTGMLQKTPIRLTPRIQITNIIGDPQNTTLANEDSLTPFLSAGSLFSSIENDGFDRGWLGTRVDIGLNWQANTQNWTSQSFIGQRFQSSQPTYSPKFSGLEGQQSAVLLQLNQTHIPSNTSLMYLGRLPVTSDQASLQSLNLSLPVANWQASIGYAQASATEMTGGEQASLSIQSPTWQDWRGQVSINKNLAKSHSSSVTLSASYLDCCVGIDLFYDYKEDSGKTTQEIGFNVNLIGLTSIDQRGLLKF